jgi:hypothetical protein
MENFILTGNKKFGLSSLIKRVFEFPSLSTFGKNRKFAMENSMFDTNGANLPI